MLMTGMVPIKIIDSTSNAGLRDTVPQEGIAGLWNAEEGADGRRRRTLDKGVDQ